MSAALSALPLPAEPPDAAPVAAPAPAPPCVPRRVRVGMPHLDAGGLSEGWLLRHAGDLQWEAIGRRLGVTPDQIHDDGDERLYPTVVALRARYDAPLSAVRENDVLEASAEVVPCGRTCAHGHIVVAATAAAGEARARLSIELLTTFAMRQADGTLRMALPAARLASRWTPEGDPPALDRLARAARRGEPLPDLFAGPSLDVGAPLGRLRHEPSPYGDYNGARLLYFAAYPTIADTVERQLVHRLRLGERRPGRSRPPLDWALRTSPVRRDVFYYANLPLADALLVELLAFEPAEATVKTRVRLRRASDGRAIADVVTRRMFVRGEARP